MKRQLISGWLNGRIEPVRHILFILSIATTIFSFIGFTVGARGLEEYAVGLTFAIASGAALFCGWDQLLRTIPFKRGPSELFKSAVLVIAWTGLVFWMSSALNVTGMRGNDAVEMHLSNHVEQAESVLDANLKASLVLASVASDIRLEIARYTAGAKSERLTGAYTGAPGKGGVYEALLGIAGRLNAFLIEADAFEQRRDTASTAARAKLDAMRKIATDTQSLEERLRTLARTSNTLRQDLIQVDPRPLSEALQRVLKDLPREVDSRTQLSPNPELARRQRAALNRVRQDIIETNSRLDTFIADALGKDIEVLPQLEDITPYKAVLVYWDQYLPFWIAGIALDMLPLFIMLNALLAISPTTDTEQAHQVMKDMTLEEYVRGMMIQKVIRSAGMDDDAVRKLLGPIQGQDKERPGLEDDTKGDEAEGHDRKKGDAEGGNKGKKTPKDPK